MWNKLKTWFTNRWVLSAIGLLVLALLIWFAGDAIAFYDSRPLGSAAARIGLIVLIVLAFVAWEVFKYWRAWRANKQMLAAIGGGEASNAALSQREVAELKQRFDQAMGVLRTARFEDKAGGGRNYLYQLPWYMFIGAPGSGKTTALVNSGLRFPLAEKMGKEAIKGVGGTRNCDWWFTDEAVLLDTAGRYTTQSSNREVDASAWMGFLNLLKRFRPQQPLNGAIITLSVSDLFVSSAEERADYARSVRARIQDLYKTLGVRFPLYVMLTKTDLLAGFSEFYTDLGREARAQVWGMTFDFKPDATGQTGVGQFEREFDLLLERLNQRLLVRMEEERDPQRRAMLFAFPQQFAGLKGLVKDFLDEVFPSSAFSEEAMFRGVYFSSGTQEGSPFDRVLGNISRAYGLERQVLPPAAASGRSYFLTRLLREVVFAESDIGGRSALIEKRRGRLLLAGYSAVTVLALLLVAGWGVSFVRNKALVNEVASASEAAAKQVAALPKPQQGDVLVTLGPLNTLRSLPTGHAQREASVPFSQGLGLYQGDKLGVQTELAYQNLLRDAFLPRVALRLEQQIREAGSPEVRYEALKTYLMLYDGKHLSATDVEAWVSGDWDRTLPRDADRAALQEHLRTALQQQPLEMVLPQDKVLVEEVRRQLASASLSERAYSRLKRLGAEGVPDFRVSDAAGASAALVLVRASGTPLTSGIPAMFTVRGYDKAFRAQAPTMVAQLAEEESWVLGPQLAGQGVSRAAGALQEVQRLYLNDYIKAWDGLLGDLRLIPSTSLQTSIQAITLLSAPDSPLKTLLVAAAKETKLATGENRSAEAAAAKTLDKVTNTVKNTVDKLLGDKPAAAATAMDRPEAVVDRHFEQLHRVVSAPAGAAAPLDAVLGVLKEYEVQLRATDEAIKRGTAPQSDAMVVARIKSEADRMPPPVNNLLNSLVSRSTGQAASSAQAGVEKAVAGEIGVFCKQAVDNRYPFAKGQTKEVPLGDFARLFGPGGTMDTFLKTKLQGMVDTSGPVWKSVKLAEGVDGLPATTVAQFQRAAVIRDAFFPTGAPSPQASADLLLTKLDDGISELQLTVDGQTTRLIPGAGSAVRLSWPSLSPQASVKLSALQAGRPDAPLAFDGPWALFRLVDAGKQEGGTPERMALSYTFGDRKATFELRSSSVRNPLRLAELSQFRCPG